MPLSTEETFTSMTDDEKAFVDAVRAARAKQIQHSWMKKVVALEWRKHDPMGHIDDEKVRTHALHELRGQAEKEAHGRYEAALENIHETHRGLLVERAQLADLMIDIRKQQTELADRIVAQSAAKEVAKAES